jgi:hypothetical protein
MAWAIGGWLRPAGNLAQGDWGEIPFGAKANLMANILLQLAYCFAAFAAANAF